MVVRRPAKAGMSVLVGPVEAFCGPFGCCHLNLLVPTWWHPGRGDYPDPHVVRAPPLRALWSLSPAPFRCGLTVGHRCDPADRFLLGGEFRRRLREERGSAVRVRRLHCASSPPPGCCPPDRPVELDSEIRLGDQTCVARVCALLVPTLRRERRV